MERGDDDVEVLMESFWHGVTHDDSSASARRQIKDGFFTADTDDVPRHFLSHKDVDGR